MTASVEERRRQTGTFPKAFTDIGSYGVTRNSQRVATFLRNLTADTITRSQTSMESVILTFESPILLHKCHNR